MPDLIETGLEPEFVVSELAWAESINGGSAVRLCFAHKKHGHLVAQYTAVMSIVDLVTMMKTAGEVVAKQGGLLAWVSAADVKAH